MTLPPPPDRSPLASLDERRLWLGRVEVAYVLPREGALWIPSGVDGPVVSVDGHAVRAVAPDGGARELSIADGEVAGLERAWTEAWTCPEGGDAELLLHYRGLFRVVGAGYATRLVSWLTAALAR